MIICEIYRDTSYMLIAGNWSADMNESLDKATRARNSTVSILPGNNPAALITDPPP